MKALTKELFDELVSIAYQANNHARRMANKYCPHVELDKEYEKIDNRSKWLSENVADKESPKIVQS